MSMGRDQAEPNGDLLPADANINRAEADLLARSTAMLAGELPRPQRERWQPLRAGLLNIYLFDDERFPFADGRLLLRGTNATGKSRVLAFMLPFLLDGSLHANRLEPDRDVTRQVAWNLLMGEHHDRLGYTWLEVGRLDAAGAPQFLTLGCGLRAIKDRGIVEHWFFITPQRIDLELSLVTPHRTALTRRQLIEILGERGQCFERSTDYRRAVDERLFRLADRFDGLIDLLLCLRQPQLAKKLDLEQLQSALTEALPPLPAGLMTTAADAFRSLDDDRRRLQASRDAFEKTQAFLRPYRQHVRMGLRRAAHAVRSRNSSFENAGKDLREKTQIAEQLRAQQQDNDAQLTALAAEYEALDSRIHVLEQSDEARAATRLDEKRRAVDTAKGNAQRLENSCAAALQVLSSSKARLEANQRHIGALRQTLRDQANESSRDLGPQAFQQELLHQFAPAHAEDRCLPIEDEANFNRIKAEAERWRRYVGVLNEKSACIEQQQARWQESQRSLNGRNADYYEAAEASGRQAAKVGATRSALWQQVIGWYEVSTDLKRLLGDIEGLEAEWLQWAENAAAIDPAAALLDTTYHEAHNQLAELDADLRVRLEMLSGRRGELDARLKELQDGVDLLPAAPPTRPIDARDHRAGAPFWKLVDFAPFVPLEERAGWEAALQASGLLDAWLEPDGRLQDTRREDTTLVARDRPPLTFDRQLARVLVPIVDREAASVAPEVIWEVLARIGVGTGASETWVDRSGSWQNGPLHGHWQKKHAEFLGPDAQKHYRMQLVADVIAELAEIDLKQQSLQIKRQEALEQCHRLDAQRANYPSCEALRTELTSLAGFDRATADAERRRQLAAEAEQAELDELTARLSERRQVAADLGLADWVDRGNQLAQTLDRFRGDLRLIENIIDQVTTARHEFQSEQQQLRQAAERHAAAEHDARASQLEAHRQESELETLLESHGAAAVEITARLATAREDSKKLRGRQQDCQDRRVHLAGRVAGLETELEQIRCSMERHDSARRDAVGALELRAARGLLELADLAIDSLEVPWSLTQGLDVARAIERASGEVSSDDEQWERSQARLHTLREELRSNLSAHNIEPEPEFLPDGLHILRVPFRGSILRVDQLAEQLDVEVEEHERVLSEKERQVLEDFLLGEVGSELHRRMHQAGELVERMTAEVSQRPMSTGMQMRFRWELSVDASEELKAAHDILMRMQETWSATEREGLIRFLQRQIQTERTRDPSASRHEQLRAALDYRRWHELRIERRAASDQPWRALTRRTYGAGSGGEKAIALTIPQLAAAAAYYSSADRHAPRFILLDEAFAGISADNRGSCLELLVSFDLDVVMTSENERGCYPGVPALAICRLSRVPDVPAVVNDIFVWNGKKQTRLASATPYELARGAVKSADSSKSSRNGQLF